MLLQPADRRVLALTVAAAVLVTGCVGQEGPDAAPASTAGMAVQPGVDDPHEFVVEVRAETEEGPPIAGATVVFFMNRPDATMREWGTVYINETEWPPDERLDPATSEHFDVLAVGTTDAEGRLIGLLDPDVEAPNVAVGGVEGYTTEAVIAAYTVAAGPVHRIDPYIVAQLDGPLVVPLFRTERTVAIDGVLGTTVNTTALPLGDEDPWQPTEVSFEPATSGYLARLDRLDLELRWNNTATAHGDLHLRAWASPGGFAKGDDQVRLPLSGANVARLDADFGWTHELRVGPATDTLAGGADRLPYRIQGTAHFASAPIVLPDGPG